MKPLGMYSKSAVEEPLVICWVVAGCWKAVAEVAKMAPATILVVFMILREYDMVQ